MSSIQLNNLTYIPQSSSSSLFNNINLTFSTNKIGLVGRNGVGKSTLLKLIAGDLQPTQGSIVSQAKIAYLCQERSMDPKATVAMVIGIQEKLDALQRITHGSIDPQDYTCVGDDWLIEERAKKYLNKFDLGNLTLQQKTSDLSGGEYTRLNLINVFIQDVDYILLDEPTNNLDQNSRQLLYKEINNFKGGLIIVSHDRALLRCMDQIIELTTLGANVFGGNFDDYILMKSTQQAAIERSLNDAKKQVNKINKNIQLSKEKHAQKTKAGKKSRLTGSQTKIILNAQKERSTSTQGQLSKGFERMQKQAHEHLSTAKQKIEILPELNIDLSTTKVRNNKVLLEMHDVCFNYIQDTNLINNFNLKIVGAERIQIAGKNGCGKSCLAQLITGNLQPQQGSIIKTTNIYYLDQHASALIPELSILDNFQKFNPSLSEFECRSRLAQLLFKNTMAEKYVKDLSGGEKVRALLACIIMAATPPELIILDEPTNHLDLESIRVIEQALKQYPGALIVISHDDDFIKNIGIDKIIAYPFSE